MGGRGSGRRPWKSIRKGALVRDDGRGHIGYADQDVSRETRELLAEPPRQLDAVAALMSGAAETVREAMTMVGYSPKSSPAAVKDRVIEEAEREGLTVPRIMRTVSQGLEAEKKIQIGETTVSEPDTQARLRAAEIGLRVHGVGQADHASHAGVTVQIIQMVAPQPVVSEVVHNHSIDVSR